MREEKGKGRERREGRKEGRREECERETETEGAGERESAQTVWSDVSSPEPAPWARLGLAAASRSRILLAWFRRFPRVSISLGQLTSSVVSASCPGVVRSTSANSQAYSCWGAY